MARIAYYSLAYNRRNINHGSGIMMKQYAGWKHMESRINVGQKAPDFTLPDTELKPRRLKDFLEKKVVLAFYPGAFTSVCTKEMCAFRDSIRSLTT